MIVYLALTYLADLVLNQGNWNPVILVLSLAGDLLQRHGLLFATKATGAKSCAWMYHGSLLSQMYFIKRDTNIILVSLLMKYVGDPRYICELLWLLAPVTKPYKLLDKLNATLV